MNKHIQTDKMSRVSKPTKASGGQVRVSEDATDSAAKPYFGYRRGGGMPSAQEPYDCYTNDGGKKFERIFGKKKLNVLETEFCKEICEYQNARKRSGCDKFIDVDKCPRREDGQ